VSSRTVFPLWLARSHRNRPAAVARAFSRVSAAFLWEARTNKAIDQVGLSQDCIGWSHLDRHGSNVPRWNESSDPEAVVKTALGRLRGKPENGAQVFRGIPYAASTAGAYRFLPPQPAQPWAGIRDAMAFGSSAPQGPVKRDQFSFWYNEIQSVSETCLTLNVFTPTAGTASRKPVMIWIHGGGWWVYSGSAPVFDGSALARLGSVVVVTVKHRLNLFGYLKLDDTNERFADSGNAGVLDLVAALRWVRENIAAFGGEPGNVTIFRAIGRRRESQCADGHVRREGPVP
jgi:hypothetical protein